MFLPLLIVAFIHHALSVNPVSVTTKKGPIVGMNVAADVSATNIGFDAFLGIPYGDKPERFQLAKARTAWTDPLVTQSDGPMCPQALQLVNEDCLYLNVYSPTGASTRANRLPVMVYVHGGIFIFGSNSFKEWRPDYLVSGGIILVTVNYRLGAPGFLSLGSKVAPGNLGLHDTLLALQWVQDEISAFGGDPTQVTLGGHSAGGIITQLHYLSPLSIGLFQRAIIQSGSALMESCWTTGVEARRRAFLLAQRLKCDTSQNDTIIVNCLQKANIKDIVGNQSIPFSDYDMITGKTVPFVPVLDTNATADKPFFSDSLNNLLKAAEMRAKPMMSGFTRDEGIVLFPTAKYLEAEANLPAFLPEGERSGAKVNSIRSHYFNQTPTLNKIQGLISLYSDFYFIYPVVKVMRQFANVTYAYIFTYDGSWGTMYHNKETDQYGMKVIAHGEELSYIFHNHSLETCAANTDNIKMLKNMIKWWTNFVKTGFEARSATNFPPAQNTIMKTDSIFEKKIYTINWDGKPTGALPNYVQIAENVVSFFWVSYHDNPNNSVQSIAGKLTREDKPI